MKKNNKHSVNELVEDIVAKLNFLAIEYNMHFLLNLFLKDKDTTKIIDDKQFHNEMITQEAINRFQLANNVLQKNINDIVSLISSGKICVVCVNESNIPSGYEGDWVEEGKIYVVDNVIYKKGKTVYKISGIVSKKDFEGFDSSRFQKLISDPSYN